MKQEETKKKLYDRKSERKPPSWGVKKKEYNRRRDKIEERKRKIVTSP